MIFSIVIPLYNKQDSICRAVHSALDQVVATDMRYEIIIVDDGSNDNSLSMVNEIQTQYSDREIIVYSQENAGVSAARNKGIELASGKYIAFLDADDTYQPNFLSEIQALICKHSSAAMFTTSYRFIDVTTGTKRDARIAGLVDGVEHQKLEDFFHSAAHGDLPITSSSVCIAKFALKEIGGFPQCENMGEDQSVWSQIALKYPVAISRKVCANYFEDVGGSLMQTVVPKSEMPFSLRLQKRLDENEQSIRQVASVKQYIAGHLLDLVRRNMKIGDVATAKKIVSDKRVRYRKKRWLFWILRVQFQSLFEALKAELIKNVKLSA